MALILIAAGCADQQKNDTVRTETIVLKKCTMADAMTAGRQTLSEMYFKIDKFDADTGYISTQPLHGKQFFELWRSDNASSEAAWESNTQSIVRTITLNFKEDGDRVFVHCTADKKRFSMPDVEIYSVSQAMNMLTIQHGNARSLAPENEFEWIDLGRDPALEDRVLDRIEHNIARTN